MKKFIFIMSIILCSIMSLNAQSIKEINSTEANAMLEKDKKIIILDVRTPDEFNVGHIKGALNIDISRTDALARISALDRKAKYIVYCRTSRRSKIAVDYMAANGFENIYHMMDGFTGWSRNGLPAGK